MVDPARMKGYATVQGEVPKATQEVLGTAAIVVTYNRADVLRSSLLAIREQEWAPGGVFVIDNDSRDHTADMVRSEFPEVSYHRLDENLGFGAGLAAGMAEARRRGYRYFWLLDDDSRPAPVALKHCMQVTR